ncbi:unnamed protein product [Sphacelaria rigidula]
MSGRVLLESHISDPTASRYLPLKSSPSSTLKEGEPYARVAAFLVVENLSRIRGLYAVCDNFRIPTPHTRPVLQDFSSRSDSSDVQPTCCTQPHHPPQTCHRHAPQSEL